MKIIFLLLALLLVSCTETFSDQVIEKECFSSFQTTPLELFPSLSKKQYVFVWALTGGGNGDKFKIENGIVGYIVPENYTMAMEKVENTLKLTVTGSVLKNWPNWGESNIGGSKRDISLVLSDGKNKYLLMEQFININLKLNLPKRCGFSE